MATATRQSLNTLYEELFFRADALRQEWGGFLYSPALSLPLAQSTKLAQLVEQMDASVKELADVLEAVRNAQ